MLPSTIYSHSPPYFPPSVRLILYRKELIHLKVGTMNDLSASECSSGCESGWTLYLEEHSFLSPYPSPGGNDQFVGEKHDEEEEEVEEDLSMVSDASSGPPVFQQDQYYGNADNGCFWHPPMDATLPKNSGKRKKTRENRRRKAQEHPSFLDDTASSPIFNFTQNNLELANNQASVENILDFSEGCSATHVERTSAFHEPFGFFQSPLPGTQLQQNQWFGGKMGMR